MTPDQVQLVQDSFRAVVPIKEKAAEIFYTRLFETDPSAVPLFDGTDMAAQGAKLMTALAFVVGALKRPEEVVPAAQAMAKRHAGYGVTEGQYATVGAALLWTLEQGLGPAFTPPVREAWAAAYGLLSGVMVEAAREA